MLGVGIFPLLNQLIGDNSLQFQWEIIVQLQKQKNN